MAELPMLITARLADVRALCAKYHVRQLSIFGSAVKGTFDPERSDLDFVVEFEWSDDPLERGRRYVNMWRDLRMLFDRPVDLLVASAVDNRYLLDAIEVSKQELYAA